MTRWRGPVRPQRERAEQPPPLSGREETNRLRKKGEDCLSTASSAAPEGGDSLRAKKPDNSGGASWFVLLAVEKNEHTGSPRTTMRGPEREGKGQVPQTIFLDTASQRGMTRWRGPVRPQRERAEQPPPLSGREETNRLRKKGEDCLSTASSAAPEGGDSLRAKKPDNSGGASWFVLLAVEKNEHTGSPRTTMRGPEREGKGQVPQTIFLDTASQRGMTRWRGPVRPQRERAEQPPPLSGREETNRLRKKGEDCLSTASSAAPEGGDSLRAKKPDNSGGASWFVLLAVEKNEHTGSPRTRCGVQRGASCGYCLCRYSLPGYFWIPHQVRNDGKYRVTARYDVEHRIKCGMTEKKRNI